MSTLQPIASSERAAWGRQLAERHIGFYAVPVGPQIDGHLLHALATGSGGAGVPGDPRGAGDAPMQRVRGAMDPTDVEAKAGVKLVDNLLKGKLNADKFLAMAQQAPPAPGGVAAPPDAGNDPLKRAEQNQAIEEQRVKLQVDETLKQARRDL